MDEPQLRTERLVLRRLGTSDRDRLVEIANDRRIWRNLTDVFPHPYTAADADEFIANELHQSNPRQAFAICLAGTGDGLVIGMISCEPASGEGEGNVSIGYWLGVDYWGLGYGTEALSAALDYAIAAFVPRRLEAAVYAWNPASARLLEKHGFELEGRRRQAVIKDGDVTDELHYGRLL